MFGRKPRDHVRHKAEVPAEPPACWTCPFTVAVDTREQKPWLFDIPDLIANVEDAKYPNVRIHVPIERVGLATGHGDYTIVGASGIGIERKSHADLWASLSPTRPERGAPSNRDNFMLRLELMQQLDISYVIVEAEYAEAMRPPPFSALDRKTVSRSIDAWTQRYKTTHWFFMPGRDWAQHRAYWLMHRFWKDRNPGR
jgi:hypothetical protein